MIRIPADEMARLLTALRDEYQGSVAGLLAAARRGAVVTPSRRRLPDAVPLRSASEVLEAVRLRLVNREEARRLLGLRARPAPRAARARVAVSGSKVIDGVMTGEAS